MLKAHGLIAERRRRAPPCADGAADDGDGRGQRGVDDRLQRRVPRRGTRRSCYPLTVMDRVQSVFAGVSGAGGRRRSAPTRAVLRRVFREFGLPTRIRSDNGVPFAGPTTLARLSRLAVWWIRLGHRARSGFSRGVRRRMAGTSGCIGR